MNKILDKYVTCYGCKSGYTINFTKEVIVKSSTCSRCGKINSHNIKNVSHESSSSTRRKKISPLESLISTAFKG